MSDLPKLAGAEPTSPPEPVVIRNLPAYVADCVRRGTSPEDIRKHLVVLGYDAAAIDGALQATGAEQQLGGRRYVQNVRPPASGRRNMIVGALVCAVALALTYASMGGGGRSIIFTGAMVWGGVQFIRGFLQTCRGA